jgi:hypothetical protein
VAAVRNMCERRNSRKFQDTFLTYAHTPSCLCRLRSLIEIHNPNDTWCMARAVVVGMEAARVKEGKTSIEAFKQFCADEGNRQRRAAYRLSVHSGLPLKRLCGLEDLKLLQEYLHSRYADRFRLALFSKEANCSMVWRGERRALHSICLLHENDHFAFLGSPRHLFKERDFCLECGRVVRPRQYHPLTCPAVCRLCLRHRFPDQPCRGKHHILCKKCGFYFPNRDCFNYHRQNLSAPPRLNNNETDVLTEHERPARAPRFHKSICQSK